MDSKAPSNRIRRWLSLISVCEMVKVSKMEEAAQRKEKEVMEAKVVEVRVYEERRRPPDGKGKGIEHLAEAGTGLNQRLQKEMVKACTMEEAAQWKGMETKVAELSPIAFTGRDKAKVGELEQRLQEKTAKLSSMEPSKTYGGKG